MQRRMVALGLGVGAMLAGLWAPAGASEVDFFGSARPTSRAKTNTVYVFRAVSGPLGDVWFEGSGLNAFGVGAPFPTAGADVAGEDPWGADVTIRWRWSTRLQYFNALTERAYGADDWFAEAHATFIDPPNNCGSDDDECLYGGDQVFSAFMDRCAVRVRKGPGITCSSPVVKTKKGEVWLFVSGHGYDDKADGGPVDYGNATYDQRCDGCIDTRWAMPENN